MRIVLFDPFSGGHHQEYAQYIIQYLAEQGDDVTYITWRRCPVQVMSALNFTKGVSVDYVANGSAMWRGNNMISGAVAVQYYNLRTTSHAYAVAKAKSADILHHLYLDRGELPLYAINRIEKKPSSLFGTLFWPYFVHGASEQVTVAKRLYHGINHFALVKLLRTGELNTLFVHTDRIKELILHERTDADLRERIVVVPDPAELRDRIEKEDARRRLNLPQGVPMVLFFGALRYDKGPDVLLDALPFLTGEWVVVMAGDRGTIAEGAIEAARGKLHEPWRLIDRINYVSDSDRGCYFAATDAVVLPYRTIFKGTSGVLRRAAAAGNTIIGTDVGDVGPTISANNLGIVVEPESPKALAKALQSFLEAPDAWASRVGPSAAHYVQDQHWRKMAALVRGAYSASLT